MTGRIDRTEVCTVYYDSDGEYHREDGPAVEFANDHKVWYVHGIRHRVDGPAVVWNGDNYWYVNGVHITDEVNRWREEMGITNDTLTPEETALFVIYFGNVK